MIGMRINDQTERRNGDDYNEGNCRLAADGSHPSPKQPGFAQMIVTLNNNGRISDSVKKRLFKINGLRSDVYHAAMYNLSAVKRVQVERVIRLTSLISNRLEREKRALRRSRKR